MICPICHSKMKEIEQGWECVECGCYLPDEWEN